jgi:hypothetical protein
MTKLIEDIKSVAKKDIDVMIPNHDILLAGFHVSHFQKRVFQKEKILREHMVLKIKNREIYFLIFWIF